MIIIRPLRLTQASSWINVSYLQTKYTFFFFMSQSASKLLNVQACFQQHLYTGILTWKYVCVTWIRHPCAIFVIVLLWLFLMIIYTPQPIQGVQGPTHIQSKTEWTNWIKHRLGSTTIITLLRSNVVVVVVHQSRVCNQKSVGHGWDMSRDLLNDVLLHIWKFSCSIFFYKCSSLSCLYVVNT